MSMKNIIPYTTLLYRNNGVYRGYTMFLMHQSFVSPTPRAWDNGDTSGLKCQLISPDSAGDVPGFNFPPIHGHINSN